MEKLIIIGTSSTAKLAYSFICDYNLYEVVGFSVNAKYITDTQFCGLPVFPLEKLEHYMDKNTDYVFVAMLWNHLNADRRSVFEYLQQNGYKFATLISPYARIRGKSIGENSWIHDFCIVQDDAVIGDDCAIMEYTLIGSRVRLGNHCFCGAKSTVAGNCIVGEQTFIGINATIFDDRVVGKKCIIGACTGVNRNVPDFSVWKTSSSNHIVCQYTEDEIVEKLVFNKNVK